MSSSSPQAIDEVGDARSLEHALDVWDAVGESANAWERRDPTAAYIHIPFCNHRCGYCNFAVIASRNDLMSRYISALQKEMIQLQRPRRVKSIFVGGGTPTSLSRDSLSNLLSIVHQWLAFDNTVEWTFEANPNDVTDELCSRLRDAGVNRLSIGVQSFNDHKLRNLDRDHSSKSAMQAIDIALSSFGNVSIDLIFAAPHETQECWASDLTTAIRSGVHHISSYGLTIEKGTRFWSIQQKDQLAKPDDSIELVMYEMAINELQSAGFEHYEVSNFGRPGYQSRHNMAYWRLEGWWAFGCSASRSIGRTRSTNHGSVVKYVSLLERNVLPISDIQVLTHHEWTIDSFVFAMRTRRGVDIEAMKEFGEPKAVAMILEKTDALLREGLMCKNQSYLQLTHLGLVISDSLWPQYYANSL